MQSIYQVRMNLGIQLAKEQPCETADLVSGVPDSSLPHARGYAEAMGIPYLEVLIKNRYIGRTFISPNNSTRQERVKLKYNVLSQNVQGKSIVLIDDSIVRGNTWGPIFKLIRIFILTVKTY